MDAAHGAAEKTSLPAPLSARRPTAWQEDMGFSILLLVSIALLNIALISLGDTPDTSKREPSLMIQQVTRAPVLPTPHAEGNPDVHLFANPEDTGTLPNDISAFGYAP